MSSQGVTSSKEASNNSGLCFLKDNSLILAVGLGLKSILKLVCEHYQDLATLPDDGYPSSFLFFLLHSA
jgi:hypothetical protein